MHSEIHLKSTLCHNSDSFSSESCAFMKPSGSKKTGSPPSSKPLYTKATYNHALYHGVAWTQRTIFIKRLVLPWEHPNLESFEIMSSLFDQNLILDQCSPISISLCDNINQIWKSYNIVSCKLFNTHAIDSCVCVWKKLRLRSQVHH